MQDLIFAAEVGMLDSVIVGGAPLEPGSKATWRGTRGFEHEFAK